MRGVRAERWRLCFLLSLSTNIVLLVFFKKKVRGEG